MFSLPNLFTARGQFQTPWRNRVFALLLLPVWLLASHLKADDGTLLRDTIVDAKCMNFPAYSYDVPTVMGEAFQQDGVVTSNGWQYSTYYNSARHVCVGRRQLPAGSWQIIELTDYYFASNDSHNDVVMGICPTDGTIHLSYDHHNNDLHYRVSVAGVTTNPTGITWSAALFPTATTSQLDPGDTVTLVTYPCFITAPSGHLLLTVRYGASGGGDQTLYVYDGTTHAWTKKGAFTIRSGSYTGTFTTNGTDRNAYVDWTYFDASGRLHMTWCWRETPDALSNHDLMYAYSDDEGSTWKNGAGVQIAVTGTSQISINSPGIVGWNIPQKRGLINNSASCIDNQGIIHVMTWQLPDDQPDETSFSELLTAPKVYHHYWRGTDNVWHRTPTTLTGTRAKIVADDDGRLYLSYGDTTNVQVAMATRESGWTDWAPLALSGALPSNASSSINTIIDYARWNTDRILSIYAQEINPAIPLPGPTPLHVLDYHVSRLAVLPTPAVGGTASQAGTVLGWTPGVDAVSNEVYFGTSKAAVSAATTASPEYVGKFDTASYSPGSLLPQTTYYWRVDSVRADGSVLTGRVWSFATPEAAPVITSADTASAQVSVEFLYQITASNSPTSFDASGLPAGLSVDTTTGRISGTPTVEGTFAVVLSAKNATGPGTGALTLKVAAAPPAITSALAVNAQVGAPFIYQIVATNTPNAFGATGLPDGLNLDPATGIISGTPTKEGTFSVSLSASNGASTSSATMVVTVAAGLPVVSITAVTPTATTDGDVGAFQVNLSAVQPIDIIVLYQIKGSAIGGEDYVVLSGHKKIKAGKLSKFIHVFPTGDLGGAHKKTVKLVLVPTGLYTVGTPSTAKVKILSGQ